MLRLIRGKIKRVFAKSLEIKSNWDAKSTEYDFS